MKLGKLLHLKFSGSKRQVRLEPRPPDSVSAPRVYWGHLLSSYFSVWLQPLSLFAQEKLPGLWKLRQVEGKEPLDFSTLRSWTFLVEALFVKPSSYPKFPCPFSSVLRPPLPIKASAYSLDSSCRHHPLRWLFSSEYSNSQFFEFQGSQPWYTLKLPGHWLHSHISPVGYGTFRTQLGSIRWIYLWPSNPSSRDLSQRHTGKSTKDVYTVIFIVALFVGDWLNRCGTSR